VRNVSPLFSVTIPTYNRCDLVVQAVQSVLDQTCDDVEVVVSDNHSTDQTRDAVGGFLDSRVRYVIPERHLVLPDSWEFARTQAAGRLVMALSDDDALIPAALEHFTSAHDEFDADFLFCTMAEYRDVSFPDERANTLAIPAHTRAHRRVDRDLLLSRLLAFHPKYNTHPSGYVFESRLADEVAARNGRFFQTQGVEYFAWPVAAAIARSIANIDVPVVVIGRTSKSWGTNMVLTNPGPDKIDQFLSDVQTDRRHTPLSNFSFNNMALEGILTAKEAFPEELAPWDVDFAAFAREMRIELEQREAQGVDVSRDMAELDAYEEANRSRAVSTSAPRADPFGRLVRRVRNRLRGRIPVHPASLAVGDTEGFSDAFGASRFLARLLD